MASAEERLLCTFPEEEKVYATIFSSWRELVFKEWFFRVQRDSSTFYRAYGQLNQLMEDISEALKCQVKKDDCFFDYVLECLYFQQLEPQNPELLPKILFSEADYCMVDYYKEGMPEIYRLVSYHFRCLCEIIGARYSDGKVRDFFYLLLKYCGDIMEKLIHVMKSSTVLVYDPRRITKGVDLLKYLREKLMLEVCQVVYYTGCALTEHQLRKYSYDYIISTETIPGPVDPKKVFVIGHDKEGLSFES